MTEFNGVSILSATRGHKAKPNDLKTGIYFSRSLRVSWINAQPVISRDKWTQTSDAEISDLKP